MQALEAQIDKRAQTAEQDARAHLDAVKKRMEQDRAKVTAAENDMKKWADERKAATNEKIAQWKAKLEKASRAGQTTPKATPPLQRSSQWPRWRQPSGLRSKHG
jgi:uncharacterized protein (DUF885 family)